MLPENFDWEFYLEYYEDLRNAGLKTKEDAETHYLNHGQYENRLFYNEVKEENKDAEKLFKSMCKSLIPFLPKEFPIIDKNSYKKSLLVETRELEHNEFVIKNTIQKLGDGWGHIIYCHNNNYNQIKLICDGISSDIEIRLLDFELTRNTYNNLCLDINFWNEIDCKKVLIYQTDTFIFNKFDDKFLEWDYLGAMWYNSNLHNILMDDGMKLLQGNGGLSLRTVSFIKDSLTDKDFIKKINIISDNTDKIPEDIYFSSYIMIYGKHKENTEAFSIEPSSSEKMYLTFNENPFGFHKIYNFNEYNYFIKKYKIKLIIENHIYNVSNFSNKDYTIIKNNDIESFDLSVIISLYNHEQYITRAIDSVLNNNFKDFEIVILNDCSTDNSLQTILPYLETNKNITIVDKNTNTGLSHTRNLGIDICQGDYVFILDSDNEIYENCLSEHFNALKEDYNLSVCYGIVECFNEKGVKVSEVSNKKFDSDLLKDGNYIDAMAMFDKKKLIEIGKYNLEMIHHGYGWEDYELWLRVGENELNVGFLNKPLSKYHIKKESMIRDVNLFFMNENIKYLKQKYKININ
jgi:hypothetical protein